MNNYNITQITDNSIDDTFAQISGGNITWSGNDGNDTEIFFYDGSTVSQITDNEVFDTTPQISGSNLAWLRTTNDPLIDIFGGSEVIFYDSSTATSLATLENITTPAISGNNVVWGEGVIGGAVKLYDGVTTTELTDSGFFATINSGSLSGNSVVWTGVAEPQLGQILLYDGTATTQITQGDLVKVLPVVSEGNIAWAGSDASGSGDIFFYNGTTTTQLTDNSINEVVLGISGNNVTWVSSDDPSTAELFLYNGTETIKLTDDEPGLFFAYETEVEGTIPIYRFYNSDTGAHFYTPSAVERDNVEQNLPDFQSEGIAYYALPLETDSV